MFAKSKLDKLGVLDLACLWANEAVRIAKTREAQMMAIKAPARADYADNLKVARKACALLSAAK